MHSSCSLRALLLLPPLLLVATPGPARALTKDEQRAMVELHNLYRSQVFPPASDMRRMRWDPELAAFAKAYAQQCVWGHNKERGRRGENLFAITDEGLDVPLAMEEWHHEREHYNLSAAACTPGQMCGHYTQVVWGKTERIGCGSHFCEKLQGVEETNIHLLVCNYEPPGNVKGQRPYQEGIPCSQCPPDYRCENSLCEQNPVALQDRAKPAGEDGRKGLGRPVGVAGAGRGRGLRAAGALGTRAQLEEVPEQQRGRGKLEREPISGPEEEQDLPSLETAAPSTRATEASGSRKAGAPSPATEVAHFWGTEVSGSPATQAPPTVETKTPSSSATKEPSATATEARPSLTSTESREWRLSSGHMWGPSQGLLLLPPLMLAGLF
ncbi:peptidase inhibitor 16 isoform 3-T3 [Callospermophilus lateralis]|uniref:peptidase inhibitor 16 isoform X3 n=1 Tax=Callospermophilus lateralis TaxID=76772 RepID=UPI004038A020